MQSLAFLTWLSQVCHLCIVLHCLGESGNHLPDGLAVASACVYAGYMNAKLMQLLQKLYGAHSLDIVYLLNSAT